MARNYRDEFETGSIYHVYNKVVSDVTLFNNDEDYTSFLERYARYFSPYFETFAYCLIPNHFHFLVRVKDNLDSFIANENTNAAKKYLNGEESLNFFLEHQLSRMLSGVAIKYNNLNNRVGPLFKQGTKRVALTTESRIIYQLCYIHHNPIHHKLTSDYKDWKFSSYHAYTGERPTQISKGPMLDLIGGIDVFHALHKDYKLESDENLFDEG